MLSWLYDFIWNYIVGPLPDEPSRILISDTVFACVVLGVLLLVFIMSSVIYELIESRFK